LQAGRATVKQARNALVFFDKCQRLIFKQEVQAENSKPLSKNVEFKARVDVAKAATGER
jgi:hypothetical protein